MRYELYTFTHGDIIWRFTSHGRDITYEDNTYKHVRGLKRSGITDKDINKAEITVTLPQPYSLDGLEDLFLKRIFYQGVYLTIQELEDDITLVLFKGRVVKPSFDEDYNTIELTCSTAETEARSRVFTRQFQRSCPNQIFDRFCGLNIEDWSFDIEIIEIESPTRFEYEVVPTQVLDEFGEPVFDENDEPVMEVKDTWFPTEMGMLIKDGVATMLAEGVGGGTGILYREHVGLAVGDIVTIAAGCNQSREMCHTIYSNQARFGGFINIPAENPVYTRLIK